MRKIGALPRALRAAFIALALTFPVSATAEPDKAQSAPEPIVPPALIGDSRIAYPDGAEGDAAVLLGITVGTDGSVRDVRLIEGKEPFATIARSAALGFRFTPARRGAVAIAAVIKFEARFQAPQPAAAATPPSPFPPESEPRGAPKSVDLEEVEIRGAVELAPQASSLGRAEIRQLPGAFGDPFRAIDVLPGVTPIFSGLPYFYVRGSPPSNVGYFVDGVRVPYLFHFALGPSVLHPALIERVDLYPGAYPAQYGRFAGAIVSAELSPPRAEVSGEANLRLIDAGALVEAPFANGDGHALLGGRYSYTAALLTLLAEDVNIQYRDYQARFSYKLTPKDTVSVLTFGAFDLASGKQDGVETVFFASEFYRADLRYDRDVGRDGTLRAATSIGFDRTRIEGNRFATTVSVAPRLTLAMPISKVVTLRAGADALIERYSSDPPNPFAEDDASLAFYDRFFAPHTDASFGVYGALTWTPFPGIEVTPGLRADVFTSAGAKAAAVDPRVASRSRITKGLALVTANGIAHQAPAFLVPIPALSVPRLRGGLQTSFQSSAGIEAQAPLDSDVTLSVFRNQFFALGDAIGTVTEFSDDARELTARTNGYAIGAEFLAKRRLTKRVGALVSYTLSRSIRKTASGEELALFDRTHVMNAALTLDLGRKWRFGTRFLVYSGRPNTLSVSGLADAEASEERVPQPDRTPAFYRLDFRLEKRWSFGDRGWVAFIAEALNATLNREAIQTQCFDATRCKDTLFGPVSVPSIGVEGGLL